MTRTRRLATTLAAALVLAACGGEDKTVTGQQTSALTTEGAPTCDEAHEWAVNNQDRLPADYDGLVAHSMVYRRAIFSQQTPEVRAKVWREQWARYMTAHPNLTPEQLEVLHRADVLVGNPSETEALKLGQDAVEVFGVAEAKSLFGTLGPTDGPAASVVKPMTPSCDCTSKSGAFCQTCDSNAICNAPVWGCGPAWLFTCDGICR